MDEEHSVGSVLLAPSSANSKAAQSLQQEAGESGGGEFRAHPCQGKGDLSLACRCKGGSGVPR